MVVWMDVDHNGEPITTFGTGDATGEFETLGMWIGDIAGMTVIVTVIVTVTVTVTVIVIVTATVIETATAIETAPGTTIGDIATRT